MSIAQVSEIKVMPTRGFFGPIKDVVAGASTMLRKQRHAWTRKQPVPVEDLLIIEFQVNPVATFADDE